jgi:hypothetical protein
MLRHLWRCVGRASSEVGEAPSISTPPSTARQQIASRTTDLGSSHEGCEPDSYRSLALRVGELERVLQERASLSARSFISREVESGRPLAFLRHKVGKELEKPIGCTIASARKHSEAHAVMQQAFSINTDCTLAEFEGICRRSRNLEASTGPVYFYPNYPCGHSSRLRDKYEVSFPSYTSLCNLLGVSRNEDIAATVKKTKFERRSETILLVRIIGALLKPREASGDETMVLAVSNSLASCFDPERSLNVLHRRSCVWDPVEGNFTEKLFAREIKFSELEPADVGRDCSSSNDNLGSGTELDFSISWVRTSRHTEGAFEPYDEERVLGDICVTIPFVLFKGNVLCREVDSLCSDSFINRTIH